MIKNLDIALWSRGLMLIGVLAFAGCGGGGGGAPAAGPAGVTTTGTQNPNLPSALTNDNPQAAIADDDKFTASTGRLTRDIRTVGHGSRYTTDAAYKELVDEVIIGLAEVLEDEGNTLAWPSDVPVVFTGCGVVNAYFGNNFNVHEYMKLPQPNGPGVANPSEVFGDNIIAQGGLLVMCHELTEKAVDYFLGSVFTAKLVDAGIVEPELQDEQRTIALIVFLAQVAFHELGHGLDRMLLEDTSGVLKSQYEIPKSGTCGAGTGCNTTSEDFADWISAYILVSLIEDELESPNDPADPNMTVAQLTFSLVAALDAWPEIIGAGGGTLHSLTDSRQINMACFSYGGSQAIREHDVQSSTGLGTAIASQVPAPNGSLPAYCQTTYNTNDGLTTAQLSQFVRPDGTTAPPAGPGTESEPNNDIATANTIVSTITGSVFGPNGGPDFEDGFKFTPTSTGSKAVTLTWTGTADLDFLVLDATGNTQISSDGETLSNPETATFNVVNGVPIIITVIGFDTEGAAVDYTLTIQ